MVPLEQGVAVDADLPLAAEVLPHAGGAVEVRELVVEVGLLRRLQIPVAELRALRGLYRALERSAAPRP